MFWAFPSAGRASSLYHSASFQLLVATSAHLEWSEYCSDDIGWCWSLDQHITRMLRLWSLRQTWWLCWEALKSCIGASARSLHMTARELVYAKSHFSLARNQTFSWTNGQSDRRQLGNPDGLSHFESGLERPISSKRSLRDFRKTHP